MSDTESSDGTERVSNVITYSRILEWLDTTAPFHPDAALEPGERNTNARWRDIITFPMTLGMNYLGVHLFHAFSIRYWSWLLAHYNCTPLDALCQSNRVFAITRSATEWFITAIETSRFLPFLQREGLCLSKLRTSTQSLVNYVVEITMLHYGRLTMFCHLLEAEEMLDNLYKIPDSPKLKETDCGPSPVVGVLRYTHYRMGVDEYTGHSIMMIVVSRLDRQAKECPGLFRQSSSFEPPGSLVIDDEEEFKKLILDLADTFTKAGIFFSVTAGQHDLAALTAYVLGCLSLLPEIRRWTESPLSSLILDSY